jgi:hypothetical protein
VDGIERKVEEPGFAPVPVNERHRLAAEGVGRVVQLRHGVRAPHDAVAVKIAV